MTAIDAIRMSERLELLRKVRRRMEPLRRQLLAEWTHHIEPTEELLNRASEYIYLSDVYLRLVCEAEGDNNR